MSAPYVAAVVMDSSDGMQGFMDVGTPISRTDILLGYAVVQRDEDGFGTRQISDLYESPEAARALLTRIEGAQ